MKVFISVDMEGVTGVTDPEDVLPDGADYARGRVFMTGAHDQGTAEADVCMVQGLDESFDAGELHDDRLETTTGRPR